MLMPASVHREICTFSMKVPRIRIEFSEEETRALDYERYHHPHPPGQRKLEALWRTSHKLPPKDICRLTGISTPTLCTYLQAYQEGGIKPLQEINLYKPTSAFSLHAKTIASYFRAHPPVRLKEAREKIYALTEITRSLTHIRQFLTALGMRPRTGGMMPAKGDAKKQDPLKKKRWSHAGRQHKQNTASSIVWMLPPWSVPPFVDISGRFVASLCEPHQGENAFMSWVLSRLAPMQLSQSRMIQISMHKGSVPCADRLLLGLSTFLLPEG
jgi:transposase